jgi:hypothetical protein
MGSARADRATGTLEFATATLIALLPGGVALDRRVVPRRVAARDKTRSTFTHDHPSPVSAMRRAVHDGQMPRRLQLNATTISSPHAWHRTRASRG